LHCYFGHKFLEAAYKGILLEPFWLLRRLFFKNELRAAMGGGNKRTRATIGAPPERPFAKEFAAMLPKSMEGSMNLKNTNAMSETKMLTYQGHSTSKFSMDSSLRAINLLYRITEA